MNITKVYFDRPTEEEFDKNKKLIGFADIVIDYNFVIHDIAILNGKKGPYLVFPQKNYNGKCIAFPVNEEARIYMLDSIIEEIKKEELNYNT